MRQIIKSIFKGVLQAGLVLTAFTGMAQLPECDKIYFETYNAFGAAPPGIYIYDPNLPPGANNPVLNTIQLTGPAGLAVSKILGTTNNTYTFYTKGANGNFFYYDPATLTWTNTGHQAGAGAVNMGAGGGFIYNLDGANGIVYQYDGTGDATVLISGNDLKGTVYDIIVDCEGNFYLFKPSFSTSNPLYYLRKYSPTGVLLQSWNVINGEALNAGFHIVGNTLYAGYFTGGFIPTGNGVASVQMTGTTIDFANATLTGAFTSMPPSQIMSDWATCQIGQPTLPVVTIASSDTVLCGSRNVGFWITGLENQGNTPAFQWLVNGVPVAGATDTFYTYAPQNGDVVTCQLSSSDLCATSMTVTSNSISMVVDNAVQPELRYSPNEFCTDAVTTALPDINTSGGTFSAADGLSINVLTGEITPSLSAPGEYVVTYTNPEPVVCPLYSASTVVNVYPPGDATIEVAKFKQPVCLNDTIVLHAREAKGSIYYWEPAEMIIGAKDEPTAVISRKMPGMVTLTVYAKGACTDKDSIYIDAGKSCCQVFVPNAFTPNGDGLNDVIQIGAKDIQAVSSMRIFNRYGQIVFETNNKHAAWDGTAKEKPCDAGVYYYQVSYTCDDGMFMQQKGDITLIR